MLLIFFMALSFMQLKHPLAMGGALMIQTTLICLMMGAMHETFWFSYILFLTFMGGMLVLFIYVASLASNETFMMSMNTSAFFLLIFLMFLFIQLIYDNFVTQQFHTNEMQNIFTENILNLIKLFNYPTNLLTILLMNYLLITLIAVVKITNIFYGPLRQMFN
uniref:NADH-ubiquinone oxidoreductase chain 6 n=1 Tax=Apocephalus antennatus TaxID=2067734 RepID=A0A343S6M2_9MUSC|nr:NADH dehydrogenase subunit 6 [Apocephalus antennatus]